jgi:FkbM family methyltransferase
MLTALKNRLLQAGPNSAVVFQAFRLQALKNGIRIKRAGGVIVMTKGCRKVFLNQRDAISVPFMVHLWGLFFDTVEGEERNGYTVLDFSRPALHRYSKTGLSFYSPSIAEDECMDAYLTSYAPVAGDIVWDVGAYAGMTTYMFSNMVGPTGKVIAFEPDETNYEFLLRNIDLHKLENVMPVKAALSDETGTAAFCMDGTMGAGLTKTLAHSAAEHSRRVETLSPEDACARFGGAPSYIKMDIEGAELSVVAACKPLLKEHPVHLVIESNHVVDGKYTAAPLEAIFSEIGYKAWSSDEFGQLFTWAAPQREAYRPAA